MLVQGVEVYQNTGESMMEVYKDLWISEEGGDSRQEFGLANENVRKLASKDDSGDKTTKTDGILDLTIANMFDRMKIPLGKILGDHGPCAPYGMFHFEYRITLPQSKKILKAQGGEDKGEYKLTDLHLEYEIIESEDLVREVKVCCLRKPMREIVKIFRLRILPESTSPWKEILTIFTAKVLQKGICMTYVSRRNFTPINLHAL